MESLAVGNVTDLKDELLNARQVADLLRVHINTVYRLAKNKEIPSVFKHRRRHFFKSQIRKYISKG